LKNYEALSQFQLEHPTSQPPFPPNAGMGASEEMISLSKSIGMNSYADIGSPFETDLVS